MGRAGYGMEGDAEDDAIEGNRMEKQMTSAVSLRLIGDSLDPDTVTRMLGKEPTHTVTKGQIIRGKNTGREHIARSGIWRLDASDRTPDDLNGQITEILDQISGDQSIWNVRAARYRIDLLCGLWMANRSEGLSLKPANL